MQIYKLLSFSIITLLLANSAQAGIQTGALDWNSTSGADNAWVAYKQPYEDAERSLTITVGHSTEGEQRLYITTYTTDSSTKCNVYMPPTLETMTFNGQAVRMTKYCSKYADADDNYYSYTPTTEKGHAFVINLFKTSTTPIKLNFEGDILYVPVTGFTRVWNSAGGDAI